MKKQTKKIALTLNAERLRKLTDVQLTQIVGGHGSINSGGNAPCA